MAFEVRPDSPLNDCFQFGTTLQRASGVGTNSLVFTDFVLKRMNNPATAIWRARGYWAG
jgi:hypothetical protein